MPEDSPPAPRAQVRYETPAPKVARIVLDRPEKRNAHGTVMTYDLDKAMRRACADDEISVIILAAEGDHFSAGHDLSGSEGGTPRFEDRVTLWGQYGGPGWEGAYAREREVYIEITERSHQIVEMGAGVDAPEPLAHQVPDAIDAMADDPRCAGRGVWALDPRQHPWFGSRCSHRLAARVE